MSNDPFADQPVEPARNWGDDLTPSAANRSASVGKRVGAYIIDTIAVAIMVALLSTIVSRGTGVASPESLQNGMVTRSYGMTLVMSALMLAYFVLLEAASGQTVAKRLLRIKVVMADGSPMTLAAAFKRRVLFFIGPIIPLIGTLIDFLVPLAALITAIQDEPGHQGFHDRLAGTSVIEV
jgi:uncharacterized RDD family membrane protein YckC